MAQVNLVHQPVILLNLSVTSEGTKDVYEQENGSLQSAINVFTIIVKTHAEVDEVQREYGGSGSSGIRDRSDRWPLGQ